MDIQNSGTLTGEKLKKKICSLQLPRPPDEFVIFDTRREHFIVVSDNLTTANVDPWYHKFYLAFFVIGESVLIFIPFITGIAQDATGYSKKGKNTL